MAAPAEKRLRVLCLHPFRTNWKIFELQLTLSGAFLGISAGTIEVTDASNAERSALSIQGPWSDTHLLAVLPAEAAEAELTLVVTTESGESRSPQSSWTQ